MFFLHDMERIISLHPSFLGPNVTNYLTDKLLNDVEGTNTGHYYIVCVLDTYDISDGRVVPGSGHAEYTMHFRAVVWKPFRGEALDGIVDQVLDSGFFVKIGPLDTFVPTQMIPSDVKYDGNATPPQFTDNQDQVIEKGTHVRVKLKGIRGEVNKMYALATIKEDFLGSVFATSQCFID
ncbi:MAG: DNA-directed RNA polymerase II subunit [Chrysothrix sp. TS-e1954]|nr:MAG: DNA-directed RNA polymerase II subunit [Chrysothrix sp. TS-e1954]